MTSLYRKWRSRSFEDLVGQEHVVRTLRNAVIQGRVAHAYLLTGPRGTGKTSTARILARAVNCLNPQDGNPCNECEPCIAAQEGRALDVIEIDAASNTGVDNVRELRERAAYASGEGLYKVYIVDEVHRLSAPAFDAFLKTLEEPPSHVIFVFASTQPQKVPVTIVSRCQRLDFRRIGLEDTLSRLELVARDEKIPVTPGALALIARYASGSLRDALGLLDQVSSFGDAEITEVDIRQTLGLADPKLVARLSDYLLDDLVGDGLRAITEFCSAGGNAEQLLSQLVGYWRSLLLITSGAPDADVRIDPSLMEDLQRAAARLNRGSVARVIRVLTGQEFSPKYDVTASLTLELGYVEAAQVLHEQSPSPKSQIDLSLETKAAPLPTEAVEIRPRSRPAAPPLAEALAATPVDAGPIAPPAEKQEAVTGSLDEIWKAIVSRVRDRSLSLQALLRSGGLLKSENGVVTVGFEYDFHRGQVDEVKRRKVLEEVVSEVMRSPQRVECVQASRAEIDAAGGTGATEADDGFVDEVAERLRQYHVREMNNGHS